MKNYQREDTLSHLAPRTTQLTDTKEPRARVEYVVTVTLAPRYPYETSELHRQRVVQDSLFLIATSVRDVTFLQAHLNVPFLLMRML